MWLSPLLKFGTSTWTYEGWQGLVYQKSYPPGRFKRDCLAEYAQYQYKGEPLFRTVGFDFTFYGPPTAKQLGYYAGLLPAGFHVCSKVWEDITVPEYTGHPRFGNRYGPNPHFLDAEFFVEQILAPYTAAFKSFTGPFLFEFQRTGIERERFLPKLDRFLERLPKDYKYAVEVRQSTLLGRDYSAILKTHGVAHIYNHWTHMPSLSEQHRRMQERFTAPFVVLRLLTPIGISYAEAVRATKPYTKIVRPLPTMRADTITLVR
jgi:uncharacterized protein YecE (DUF72 family)